MGDISIIARRLKDGHVQYGWSGNGGYFKNVGCRLLEWYDDPNMIEYLFGLGELSLIGKPGSENGRERMYETHHPTGVPHHLGTTEKQIFSKILFIDYGYMYDLDNQWYYINPTPFRIKMPLRLLSSHLTGDNFEFDYLHEIHKSLVYFIFYEYRSQNKEFSDFLQENDADPDEIAAKLIQSKWTIDNLYEDYRFIHNYFDDWVVVTVDDACNEITGFKLKKKTETHIETIEW